MVSRQFRQFEEMAMASSVVSGLPLERRSTPDQVMHTLRGDHWSWDSTKKSGISPHACFSSSLVVENAGSATRSNSQAIGYVGERPRAQERKHDASRLHVNTPSGSHGAVEWA